VPRAGLSPAAVVDAAVALLDEEGPAALTLAAVAGRTGVATPSLYKHVPSLAELRRLVAVRVLAELADRLRDAALGRSGDDALAGIMLAYREYATTWPGRYALLPQTPQSDPDLHVAATRLVEVFLAVLRGHGITGSAAIHTTRALRAAAHGFVSLELAGGFGLPEDLDTSYRHLVDLLIAGISRPQDHPTEERSAGGGG
jgi:AcrR family transcriptional regulator